MKRHCWAEVEGRRWGMVIGAVLWAAQLAGQDAAIVITKESGSKLTKIAISGFTGEVMSALRFDLDIAGFTNTTPDQAQFLVSGQNQSRVEGVVTDRLTKTVVLSKAYAGGTPRYQTHAFADDIVEKLTGRKGIAQTKIAFKATQGDTSEIYMSDYDGHNPIQLTRDGTIVAAPCWVQGQRILYYTSYKLGNPDVWSYNLDSGVRRVVAHYTGLNTSAAVSPDGRHVAMIMSKAGSPDLYVANADGTNLKQLTHTKEDESSPCWSPDGKTICLASRVSGRAALYTISAEGGALKRLPTGQFNTTEPDWSPDGQAIAFTTQSGGFQICVLRLKTGESSVLTEGEDPSWAPNSRTVIFARRAGGRRVLSLLDVATKRVKDVAQISGSCSQPSWAK